VGRGGRRDDRGDHVPDPVADALMRILFVENHETFSGIVREKFLGGYEVRIVKTLAAARAALAGQPWDVVLIDHDLDDGDGVALVKELEGQPARPFIIGVSAYDDLNRELVNAGADATCGKLQFSQIEEVLRSLRN
jgi:DNA-binding response OmpR family regulator